MSAEPYQVDTQPPTTPRDLDEQRRRRPGNRDRINQIKDEMDQDVLRTRIAAVTWVSHRDRQLAQLGMKPSKYAADIPVPDWAYAIADAVIRELGLKRVNRYQHHRYVTEWISDIKDAR